MTVKGLISKLKKCSPNMKVIVSQHGNDPSTAFISKDKIVLDYHLDGTHSYLCDIIDARDFKTTTVVHIHD